MRLALVLALIAVPVCAAEEKMWTEAEVLQLAEKLQARRAAEYQQYTEILTQQELQIRELQRKVETLTGRHLCS